MPELPVFFLASTSHFVVHSTIMSSPFIVSYLAPSSSCTLEFMDCIPWSLSVFCHIVIDLTRPHTFIL